MLTKQKLKLLTLSLNKKDILEEPIENKYSTDGSFDTITKIFQPILAEFKDLIGENEDKKSFTRGPPV